jgi:hypothetical protein
MNLPTDSFHIVLGLPLRVLFGLLGVGIRLQLMDGFGQVLSFLSVSDLAPGHIRTGVHTRYVRAEAIEIHSEIVASVKGSKTSI